MKIISKLPGVGVRRLVRSFLAMRTELLWHPESPGMRVTVRRSRFGRWLKPAHFATLGETIRFRRANNKDLARRAQDSE